MAEGRRSWVAGAAAVLAVGVVVLTSILVRDRQPDVSPVSSPAEGHGGDDFDQYRYRPFRRVTEGEWRGPAVASRESFLEEGRESAKAFWGSPGFEGDVNGIYLYKGTRPSPDVAVRYGLPSCVGPQHLVWGEAEAAEANSYYIRPGYLPPGTFEVVWPNKGICDATGTVTVTGRSFSLGSDHFDPWFSISRFVGPRIAAYGGSVAPLVSPGSIGGHRAIFVRPASAAGYGNSYIFVAEDWGMTQIAASNVPFDELVRVAGGLY